jgi:large subunit ribosomal protein LP2
MKVVAAYLLATLGGNSSPSASDVQKILKSVGASAEDDRVNALLGELSGKTLEEVMKAGKAKLATVPTGGASGAVSSGASSGSSAKVEGKKEEKKEEKQASESAGEVGFGLFGEEEED